MDANSQSYPVYLGVWINWSYGRVFGSTLTLTRSDGALLIAFMAFFVAIVGTQLWRIICFILFYLLSDPSSQDGLHNQRQVILRNSTSPVGCAWTVVKMIGAWNGPQTAAQPLRRLIPLLFCTLFIGIASTIASGFSSRIAQGNEVLINGADCGFLSDAAFDISSDFHTLWTPYSVYRLARASEYAQRCYESDSTSDICGSFVRNSLPMTITSNASCPFDESMCISKDSNILIDSGPIDSHHDLGLNAPPAARFQFRYQLHCAPLVTEGHKSKYIHDNTTYTRYQYGDAMVTDSDCNCTSGVNMDLLANQYKASTSPLLEATPGYTMMAVFTTHENSTFVKESSSFVPIQELGRFKKDLDILFLLPNQVHFLKPSKDNWYRATTPADLGILANNGTHTMHYYVGDEPAWPMGCFPQYQACKGDTCTELGNNRDVSRRMFNELNVSPFLQNGNYFLTLSTPASLVTALGKQSLASRFKSTSSLHSGVEFNDWHLDIIHWFSILLADFQFWMTDIAAGPPINNPDLEAFIRKPQETEKREICSNQKIRSTAYTSFSLFGMIFAFLLGALIIIVSATLEPIAIVIQKYMGVRGAYARLEWRADQALQLHHLAHEGTGMTEWRIGSWGIPITTSRSKLAVLSATEHDGLPRLQPGISLESESKSNYRVQDSFSDEKPNVVNTEMKGDSIDGGHASHIEHDKPEDASHSINLGKTQADYGVSAPNASTMEQEVTQSLDVDGSGRHPRPLHGDSPV